MVLICAHPEADPETRSGKEAIHSGGVAGSNGEWGGNGGEGSQWRVAIVSWLCGGWSLIPQRNSGKWCRTCASDTDHLKGKGKGAGVFKFRSYWLRLLPVGVTSEHFWPKQPSKTLEKAPQERPEDISWWRAATHIHTKVVLLERCARHCSRCWRYSRKQNRVLPSWSNPSVGETDNKTRQIRNIRGVLQGDKYWGEN